MPGLLLAFILILLLTGQGCETTSSDVAPPETDVEGQEAPEAGVGNIGGGNI